MKSAKTIIYPLVALVAGLIISPFIGMAIGSTRELILGLAPEEAVLQLADKIDANRTGVEQKTNELQSLIDTQESQLAEQQQIIDQQKTELENVKYSSITSTQAQQITQTAIANAEAERQRQEKTAECKKKNSAAENNVSETKDDVKREENKLDDCSDDNCREYIKGRIKMFENDLESAEKHLENVKDECKTYL